MNTENHPIIIGLCGKAGTGKTSIANTIVPSHSIKYDKPNRTIWDHAFFAMPLYEMASIKRMTKGELSRDRILYQMHDVLADLFGKSPAYGAPTYDRFTDLVKSITDLPMPTDEDMKPREFLQEAGELCRAEKGDCFVQWARKMANRRANALLSDDAEEYDQYVCIFSDVRYENEANMIASQPGGILIRFDASNDVRMDRLYNRDGYRMPDSQLNHSSENVELIPENIITAVINTDNMNVEQQAQATNKIIEKELQRIYA